MSSSNVQALVWLFLKRNGLCRDLRKYFSKKIAHLHFENTTKILKPQYRFLPDLNYILRQNSVLIAIDLRVIRYEERFFKHNVKLTNGKILNKYGFHKFWMWVPKNSQILK